MDPTYINIVTFMTLQCHKVQPKWLNTNFVFVSKRPTILCTSKRHVNTNTTLKMSKNYYEVLGVPRNANQKQIKDAYYKLAMKHHPDKNQGELTQQFREIKEAYDVLSNSSTRNNYNSSYSNNNSKTSNNNWSSNSNQSRNKSREEEYTWTNSRTEYRRPEMKYSYNYSYHKPFNVFINVIKVPKNVVKVHVDVMLLTFIRNRALKLILFQIFQFIWSQVLKNLNYNILISSSSDSPLEEFIKNILGNNTVRIEITEMEALKGKAVRLHVQDNEKVLVVNIPKGAKKDQSFYLFYLVDDDDKSNEFKM